MKLLEKETLAAPKARRVATVRNVPRPKIALTARVVPGEARQRRLRIEAWANRAVAFAAIVGVTYIGSTLTGYVRLENARQSARRSEVRASYARKEAKAARASIEALTSPAALRDWAAGHGFVPGQAIDSPAHGVSLVARR